MKLLAQFYACLAIIVVFTAVFNGIEARSSNFMAAAAGSRRGWLAEEPPQSPPPQKQGIVDGHTEYRMRRAVDHMTEEKPEDAPKQTEEEQPPKASHKMRRNAQEEPETQKKQLQTEETPDQEHKRNRRQIPTPPGMPNPEDFAKQMPIPSGRK